MAEEKKLKRRIGEMLDAVNEQSYQAHLDKLTPQQQRLYTKHLEDQFNAVPSYLERFAKNKSK